MARRRLRREAFRRRSARHEGGRRPGRRGAGRRRRRARRSPRRMPVCSAARTTRRTAAEHAATRARICSEVREASRARRLSRKRAARVTGFCSTWLSRGERLLTEPGLGRRPDPRVPQGPPRPPNGLARPLAAPPELGRSRGYAPVVHLARSHGGWSLVDGDSEYVVEGSTPLACPGCGFPVFLDTNLDCSLCAFCNAWTDGALVPTCPPSANCGYCDARRGSVRARPLSRALTDTDEHVAEFLREAVPIRVMEARPFRRH